MSDKTEPKPLAVNAEEAYILNQIFHIGMSCLFPDEPGSDLLRALPHAQAYIETKFDDASWYAFQEKLNNFFLQYRKEGETVRRHGSLQPPDAPGGLN